VIQLKDGKAPGPDDFTSNFHKFLDFIKVDVWQVVEESRTFHWLLPSLNSNFITLTLKEEHSIILDKLRPIALCNVIYKVIWKVTASHLTPLLTLLISPKQLEYVEGWKIIEGIILTHETIHSLKHNKKVGILLKRDMGQPSNPYGRKIEVVKSPPKWMEFSDNKNQSNHEAICCEPNLLLI